MSVELKRNPSFRDVMGYLEINKKTHCLYKGLNTIGRNRTATVIIKNERVSKQHTIITIIDENKCYVSDFQSFNGTFLDKKKLQPLRLYEISHDSKIAFAEVVGIYRKVPAEQSTGDHCYNSGAQNAQNTQNLSESFYAANTQVLEITNSDRASTGIGDTSYFDDDYNFSDLPSPSFHNNDENTSDKAGCDIHNLSTQTYSSDMSDVGDCQVETKTSVKTIHDLETQIICHEVALDICVGDSQNTPANETVDSNNGPLIHKAIHDMPTQCITKEHVNISCSSSTKDGSKQEHSINSQPTQAITGGGNAEKIESAICDDSCMLNNDKSLINTSINVVEGTILDDSGLDVASSLHGSGKSQPSIVQTQAISSLESDSQSNLHVSQLNRRTLKPIADDEEEEVVESQESDIVTSKLKKKKKPILESSSDDSDSEVGKLKGKSRTKSSNKESSGSETEIENSKPTNNKTKLKLKHKRGQNEDANSGSSTEIEDLDVAENSKPKNNKTKLKSKHKRGQIEDADSGSSTEIEDLDVAVNKRRSKPRKSIVKSSSDSDTDIENVVTKVKISQSPATTTNKGELPAVDKVKKLNNSETLNDSDIIPATQMSDNDDDDEDDFNFAPEICSTLVSKANKDNTQESIDISQKLEDLRRRTVIPQECSEESIHLALTEGDDDSFKKTKENNEVDADDDDKTPDISDDDTTTKPNADKNSAEKFLSNVNKPTTSRVGVDDEEEDDIFTKATQKITIQDNDKNKPQNLYEMETQDLTEELVENKSDYMFVKPPIRGLNDKKSTKIKKYESAVKNQAADIFLQSTEVLPVNTDEDDIFMQPTQRIASNTEPNIPADEHDIFMQPTQPVLPNKIKNDDIFLEPTQKITPNQSNKSNDQAEDDVFMQPTQIIALNEKDTCVEKDPPKDDDLFMQPTQIIALNEKNTIEKDPPKDDDLFMEPTQIIEVNELHNTPASQKPSLSLKQISPKHHEIESQLEVMFATQTLQLPPETNTRPSNPLVNVFEGNQDVDSQQDDYAVKSPSSDSASLKEYCTKPTLPIDELDDFQNIPHHNEKDTNTKTSKRTLRNKQNDEDKSVAVELRKSGRRLKEVECNLTKLKVAHVHLEKIEIEHAGDSSDNATVRKSKRPTKAAVVKEDVHLEKTAKEDEGDTSDNATVRKSKRTAKAALGKEDKLTEQEPSTSASASKLENREIKKMTDELVEGNISNIKTRGRKSTKQNVKPENVPKVLVTVPSISDNDDSFMKTKVKDKAEPVTVEKKNVKDKKKADVPKATPVAIKDDENNKDLRTSRSSRSRKGIEKIEDNTAVKSNNKPIVIDSSDDDRPNSTNASKNNVATSRTTRNRSNEKKENSLVVKPNVISKAAENTSRSRRTQSKQNAVQEDETDSEASASTTSSNIPVETPSRKNKRTMNSDSSTAVTPSKRKKNTESTSANVPLRTASARKSKRILSTESEKDVVSTPSKKSKPIESSSESEEMNSTTSRRNKQLQLNTTPSTPDRNRRKQKPKVVFTMLDSPELESAIRSLGGMVVDSVDSCTVLVTGSLKRSQKLLAAVGQGKPICTAKWLQDSKKASTFLDPWDFILQDAEAERKWKFSLRESLNRSLNKKLLADFTVHLAVSAAGDVLKAAVESCGGKCVTKVPAKNTDTNFIVVASPDNKAKYSRFLKQKPPVTVVAPEAIFDGVLRQELHLEDHMLSL